MTDPRAIHAAVRERYAAAARSVSGDLPQAAACCGPEDGTAGCGSEAHSFGADLYTPDEREGLPGTAVLASLGCGNPTAVADLHAGETVLDLGSGGGIDVLLSARRVGPTGMAYGLDMTDEMLALARANQAEAGVTNVVWLKGQFEAIPLPAASVDVVISNCVINLAADKPTVIAEAARVLKPGGRFAVTDVVADHDMDATRAAMAAAGALTRGQFESALTDAGLVDVEIVETHRVHAKAGSAIVRASKPAASAGCCDTGELGSCCEPDAKDACCASAASTSAPGSCGCR